jgi:CHAT domain-containing protein
VQLPRLAGSSREVRACQSAWNSTSLRLEGFDTNWNDFEAKAQELRPSALHFATHYVISPEHPQQVLLALGLSRSGKWQYLGAEQIAALRLRPQLVVMSGCGSGNGRTVAGEGRLGLARAWLKGGANAVAATYWPTPDDAGALPQAFYRHWQNLGSVASPKRPAQALQMAQLDMIRGGSWRAEPRYWASYFLVGKS